MEYTLAKVKITPTSEYYYWSSVLSGQLAQTRVYQHDEDALEFVSDRQEIMIYVISEELHDLGERVQNFDNWAWFYSLQMNWDFIQCSHLCDLDTLTLSQRYSKTHALIPHGYNSMTVNKVNGHCIDYAWDRQETSGKLQGLKQQIEQELGYDFDPNLSKVHYVKPNLGASTFVLGRNSMENEFRRNFRFTEITQNLWNLNLLIHMNKI